MDNVRTAISVPKALLERVDAFAKKAQISRSRLFALAVEDYFWRAENEELFQAINAAYKSPPPEEEAALGERMRAKHRQLVQRQDGRPIEDTPS